MRLRLQPYDILVEYKRGKELYIADALSRSPINSDVVDDFDINYHIMQIILKDNMSETRIEQFKN